LIGAVDQDWTENSRNPIFSLSLSGGSSSSFFSSLFSDFSDFSLQQQRVGLITLLSQMGLSIWASFGHVWAILHLGGKPNPTDAAVALHVMKEMDFDFCKNKLCTLLDQFNKEKFEACYQLILQASSVSN
jgi:hypothetical protein